MRLVILFLLFIVVVNNSSAQNYSPGQLDSLFNEFLQVQGYNQSDSPSADGPKDNKCGFGIVNIVVRNIKMFNADQQLIIQQIMQRPSLSDSLITPSGFFKIHYDASGINGIKYDINELAEAADSSLFFECSFLGYPIPPREADGYYHIYVTNQGGGLYGYTQFEGEVSPGSGTYYSYILMDNDYSNYYSRGIDGARVTVAHELHHAIQVGNYIWREEDLFFYELSSTAMEEFVFDTVNDYYAYMEDYFHNTHKPMIQASGYDIALWNIYLADRFGFDVLLKQWQLMGDPNLRMRALSAIANSLLEEETTFGEEFKKFGIANFFTNYRASLPGIENIYKYEEAANYPVIKSMNQYTLPPELPISGLAAPTSNSYISFVNGFDTLYTMVSNSDYISGINNYTARFNYNYNIFDGERQGTYRLTSKYYASFSAEKPTFWTTSEIFNNTLVNDGLLLAENVDYAFPSPFYYSKNSFIFIPVIPGQSSEVELNIYTSGMDLVYSARRDLRTLFGKYVVQWNGKKDNGEKLSTGVYLFVTKAGDDINKGKLVIFNE